MSVATVAIMQPYFFPYGGYYRLLTQSDLFVVLDCVQFPRRGWVHRNKLLDMNGAEQWLTLPMVKAPQEVLIQDLRFPPDARAELEERLRPFPLPAIDPAFKAELMQLLLSMGDNVTDYLVATMEFTARHLGIRWNVIRSSSLNVPEDFRAQSRLIEIARRVGASRYLNAPGGRELYDAQAFAGAGLELEFLDDYAGPYTSMLGRILAEDPKALAEDVCGRAPAFSRTLEQVV